ncbi:hypothetical protein Hanom_Chr10g00958411 [Helianthus anomalus]
MYSICIMDIYCFLYHVLYIYLCHYAVKVLGLWTGTQLVLGSSYEQFHISAVVY